MAKTKKTIHDFVEKMNRHKGTPFPGFTHMNPPTDEERAAMKERLDYEKHIDEKKK